MRKRYLYMLMFGVPGLFLSAIVAALITGTLMGLLWLTAFGDRPWPVPMDKIILISFSVAGIIAWMGILRVGHAYGKQQEGQPGSIRNHVFISLAITLFFIAMIGLKTGKFFSSQNYPPARCQKYCLQQGYSASAGPDSSTNGECVCYDGAGQATLRSSVF